MARTSGSHAEITGPRIRAAALNLFAHSGYAAVSMRQIAGAVGLQAGALYNYTPDKQTLLFQAMQSHLTELLEAMPCAERVAPDAALEQFVKFHIGYHHTRRDEVFVAYMELRNLSEENFVIIERLRGQYEARLVALLQTGHGSGKMHVPEPKIAAMAIISMLTGVNTWFRESGRLSLDAVQDEYWSLVRGMVRLA